MSIKVLIVEDDKRTRDLIREYVAQDPRLYVVAETDDGVEAVALAKHHRPDIVLMDLSIKGVNGLKATKQIKTSLRDTDIIILTSYQFEDLVDRARESPQTVQASAFLGKDKIASHLLPVINDLIKRRPQAAEKNS